MIVTLLTDFGTADYFVGAMKGVILSAAPGATVVDITHEVPPQDVRAGAFTLLAAYGAFPPGTVHVAVVDPGVGSARRAIAAEAGGHRFVGPDNGLLSWLLERAGDARVAHLDRERFFRHPVSRTFHGRDVFAPVGAALAAGAALEEVGTEIGDWVRLDPLRPARDDDGGLRGTVLHVDRFGNVVTPFTRDELPYEALAPGARIGIGGREVRSIRRFYAEGASAPGEPFGIWGSAGFLEVSVFRGSAARLLGVAPGDPVTLAFGV
ncbi:MAG TPA: SAM-dependent chlorinase/fluorinase [Longimicrobium sp.]|nr:SAM-dependent chlorinase/fluorinase [Longimicrobium sp.]